MTHKGDLFSQRAGGPAYPIAQVGVRSTEAWVDES